MRNCGLPEARKGRTFLERDVEIYLGGGIVVDECPVSSLAPETNYYNRLFWMCHTIADGGVIRQSLPESGGTLDQDNKTMEAFGVIESEVSRIRAKK